MILENYTARPVICLAQLQRIKGMNKKREKSQGRRSHTHFERRSKKNHIYLRTAIRVVMVTGGVRSPQPPSDVTTPAIKQVIWGKKSECRFLEGVEITSRRRQDLVRRARWSPDRVTGQAGARDI